MPQFNSGAAEQIGRFSEGLLLRLLHPHDSVSPRGLGTSAAGAAEGHPPPWPGPQGFPNRTSSHP
jgi:hypothetical protein